HTQSTYPGSYWDSCGDTLGYSVGSEYGSTYFHVGCGFGCLEKNMRHYEGRGIKFHWKRSQEFGL
uniref:Uncharacterized protein n=1 Tax=Marmota marmota marmota TaxID=9994 RepID=A0A8C6A0J4_MARMA